MEMLKNIAIFNGTAKSFDSFEWNAHPVLKGVALKHIIKGEDTSGAISIHIVKIESECEITEHIHEGKLEVHEVLEGKGYCVIGEKRVEYSKGVIALIPADIKHKVVANEQGLLISAKFVTALL